jgi:hypothetical protein
MPTKSYTLILSVCEIKTFKVEEKVLFAPVQGGQQSFGFQKKPLYQVWNEPIWILIPR